MRHCISTIFKTYQWPSLSRLRFRDAPILTFQFALYYNLKQYLIMPLSRPDGEPYILIPGLDFCHNSSAAELTSPSSMPDGQERLPQPVYQLMARITDS